MKFFKRLIADYKNLSLAAGCAATVGFFVGDHFGTRKQKSFITIGSDYGKDIYHIPHNSPASHNTLKQGIFSRALVFPTLNAATKVGESVLSIRPEDAPEPANNAPRITQIMRFGFPGLNNIRSLDDFVMSYDNKNRIPHWVFEHLTEANIKKTDSVDRSKSDFHEDKSIHEYFRSSNNDYKKSGYDRGHMAAAGNHRQTQQFCDQTFLLSNMAPQVGRGFNRDKWNELEHYCRKLVRSNRNVYVCTGPLFLPQQEADGNLYVHYKVIGSNHVAVPTHFFKVIVSESSSGALSLESFILPNVAIADSTPLSTFHVPVDVVERASGLLMFDKIDKSKFKSINGKSSGWF